MVAQKDQNLKRKCVKKGIGVFLGEVGREYPQEHRFGRDYWGPFIVPERDHSKGVPKWRQKSCIINALKYAVWHYTNLQVDPGKSWKNVLNEGGLGVPYLVSFQDHLYAFGTSEVSRIQTNARSTTPPHEVEKLKKIRARRTEVENKFKVMVHCWQTRSHIVTNVLGWI